MSVIRTVLVTGASGFVGRAACRALLEAGLRVRGLVRQGSAAPPEPVEPAWVTGLDDTTGLRAALAGVDAVVHLAARVHVMHDTAADPLTEFRRVNVEGTRVVLEEAVRAGARRFVLVSSVKAMGEATGEPWTEATPPAPIDPYGISKLEAERLALGVGAELGIEVTVLRFPLVYGPGVKANMLRLFDLVDRGVPLPLGGVRNRRSVLFVDNAAAAIRTVLLDPRASGETFLVSDKQALSTPDLIRLIARALDRPARLVPVPDALFRFAGKVGDLVAHAVPFPLTSAAVERLLGSLAVDAGRLERVTGFRPPFTTAEGLRRTAAWYRTRG